MSNQNQLRNIPIEILDLDVDPSDRWKDIIVKYRASLLHIYDQLNNLEIGTLGFCAKYGVLGLVNISRMLGKVKYLDELQSIATGMGVPVSRVILMQLMYELSTCCTSSIINTKKNPIMVRTMDWALDSLDPLTINLNVMKGGRVIYQATTWVGYVGILTAVRPESYAIAINYRRSYQNSMWDNFKACWSMRWPIGYAVRDLLDNQFDYHAASKFLKKVSLIAPCYITMCCRRRNGPISGIVTMNSDGVVIQRDQSHDSDDQSMGTVEIGNKKTLTQTNIDQNIYDSDKDILYSIRRRDLANSIGEGLLEMHSDELKVDTYSRRTKLLEKYLVHPILNEETRYISLMAPGKFDPEDFESLDSRHINSNF